MKKQLLIQANGNNVRMSKFFKQPKHELFYGGERIIDIIIRNSLQITDDVYVAIRENTPINFDSKKIKIIYCRRTENRIDTLKQCFSAIPESDSTIIHDCDSIISNNVLNELNGNCIAITNYKLDGLKYGFIELDKNLKFIRGNEKENETGHITIGAYCVDHNLFLSYLNKQITHEDSLLTYYNNCNNVGVVYSKKHTNLGDIKSYMENLWLL